MRYYYNIKKVAIPSLVISAALVPYPLVIKPTNEITSYSCYYVPLAEWMMSFYIVSFLHCYVIIPVASLCDVT